MNNTNYNNITASNLKAKLDNEDILLVDVRNKDEYDHEHIHDSVLIPVSEISCDNLPSRTKPIVFYCRSGARSAFACSKILLEDNSLIVHSLDGGIMAWKESGYDTERKT